jgi:ribosomal-protein-alanine N-acetyltransferase
MAIMMKVIIDTERLSLIPIDRKYAQEIFREFTNEITTYMFPKPAEKIEETHYFIDEAMEKNKRNEQLQMVVLDKETKEFIGCAGLHKIKTRTPELGIWIKKSAHGHGYGREAIAGFEDWAQKNLDFDYLIYPVDKRNIPSRKIPESLSGQLDKEYKKTNLSGNQLDYIEYQIPKKKGG